VKFSMAGRYVEVNNVGVPVRTVERKTTYK